MVKYPLFYHVFTQQSVWQYNLSPLPPSADYLMGSPWQCQWH